MADSTQHRIGRNRSPRVQITYDVEIGNAIEKREIPFVVGIMADLSGFGDAVPDGRAALKHVSRSFVEIDGGNFGDVMAKVAPQLGGIDGALDADGNDAAGVLSFKSMDDFNPAALVKRVKSLKQLQDQRAALRDLLTKLDSNDALYRAVRERVEGKKMKELGDAAATQLTQLTELQPPAEDGKKKK